MHWYSVALAYASYLAVVGWLRPACARGRWPLLLGAAVAWIGFGVATLRGWRGEAMPPWLAIVAPALVLLAGYWMSGLLFVRPDPRIEGWLRAVDDAVLTRSGVLAWFRGRGAALAAYFELSYLLVYALVPAGAVMLALGGHDDQIDRFWTTVLGAEFCCYGMLPWIQTRPPRALEATAPATLPTIRRVNLGVLRCASIGVNTVPSGHAAGALATALAVATVMPTAGAIFLVLACSITIATVVGRYHYLVDSVLGVVVAVIAWWLVP